MIQAKRGKLFEVMARVNGDIEIFPIKASSVEMAVGQIMGKHGLNERDIIEVKA